MQNMKISQYICVTNHCDSVALTRLPPGPDQNSLINHLWLYLHAYNLLLSVLQVIMNNEVNFDTVGGLHAYKCPLLKG